MSHKIIELESLDDLQDDKVYRVSYLMAALRLVGLPSSYWWIREKEKQGLLPHSNVGASKTRHYTGRKIKELVNIFKMNVS